MRRKLDYQLPELTNSIAKIGSLNKGDWHVHKEGGKLFVGDVDWAVKTMMREGTSDAEFRLDATTSMLMQAQDKTTCRNIAIESKPAYDMFAIGGGFQAISPRTPRHTSLLGAGERR